MKQPPDWNSIVEQHAERVYRIAFRILGSVHDAEDVSQIVFTEAIAIYDKSPIKSWTGLFVRLSSLRSIDLLRKRRTPKPLSDEDQRTKYGPPEEAEGAELAEWLREAVQQLPPQQCVVFTLSHFEQLNRNDVAATLGIAPEAVSTSLHKAKQQLLTQLDILNGGIRS